MLQIENKYGYQMCSKGHMMSIFKFFVDIKILNMHAKNEDAA